MECCGGGGVPGQISDEGWQAAIDLLDDCPMAEEHGQNLASTTNPLQSQSSAEWSRKRKVQEQDAKCEEISKFLKHMQKEQQEEEITEHGSEDGLQEEDDDGGMPAAIKSALPYMHNSAQAVRLRMTDWRRQLPCWDATWDGASEEACKQPWPMGFEVRFAWSKHAGGTVSQMFEALAQAVQGIITAEECLEFYIGIAANPLKRYLGRDAFPDYDLTGHTEQYMMMRVLTMHDARLMGLQETALIAVFQRNAKCNNKGQGGERQGPKGKVGGVYICWNYK